MFLSAILLFWIQPMFGKMILPLLGSTPNVWNTCMVFFQAMLLAGYIYAHKSISWLGVKRQAILHAVILFLPLLSLPLAIPNGWFPPTDKSPVLWLLMLMTVSAGFPFFVVSANAPMLQKWFSNTSHKAGEDPYFLYVASNLGSMLALTGYPFFMELKFRLTDQSYLWMISYLILVMFILSCAIFLWRSPVLIAKSTPEENINSLLPLNLKTRWVLLSMIPSSLMLSVTAYLSTDIASVPLLWVVPLAIYLLSFVLVFARKPVFSHKLMVKIMPIMVLPVMIYILSEQTKIIWLTFLLHLLTLFVVCMVCHGELAKTRPAVTHLTEFYLWISFGGFLGGLFNALIAPVIFKTVIEYPLALVFACLLRPNLSSEKENSQKKKLDFILPLALGIFCFILFYGFHTFDMKPDWLSNLLTFGLPAILCYSFAKRPVRFGIGVGVILMISTLCINAKANILYTTRSFFGVHRVVLDSEEKYSREKCHYLVHGRILHGAQSINPARRHEPLTYYYRTGPVGQLFTAFQNDKTKSKIAVIGLGTGSLTGYARIDQSWTFYEIDPVVKQIAGNEKLFTFLKDCYGKYNIVLGDGRLSVKKVPDHFYDIFVLDAFSSDSTPTHLITKEAIKLYLDKLSPNGVLAFHISNQYLNLEPILGNLASDAGLTAYVQFDVNITPEEKSFGKKPSKWVIMARKKEDFGKLINDKRWKSLTYNPKFPIWSDDFSNILSIFNWGRARN
ncbi:MAG: hypothetical protein A3I68_00610 [Candidatus Melainabacteria bacterium RIFCSPLOWO2_02_FULL_35_15]|nr:MAG: hypothetical protein A3F80_01220 [Candidatus Melainabacteria bacterium RIFCSPLOWO2_12_FULL_35_11]OGI14352.1 MAG: hypothetical protein A3I68_00610 [Candidatus Melainabacteria bacterium RIFCSPLOWO2_02_FULL_35_15]